MSKVRVDDPDASIVYSANWATITDAGISGANAPIGGTYHRSTGAGTATLTIASSGSNRTLFLIGTRYTDNVVPTITVDGGTPILWNQYGFTSATTMPASNSLNYWGTQTTKWYRSLSAPIFLSSGISHTIVLTAAGAGVTLDGYDLYTPVAPGTPTLVAFGHSIVAGQQWGATPAAFTGLLAVWLGCAENRQGQVGESLSDWSNPTVSGGGPTPATRIVGWERIDAQATALWEQSAVAPTYAVLMECLNDCDFMSGATDPGGNGGANTYYIERFKQRTREVIWKMQAHVPACLLAAVGNPWTVDNTVLRTTKQAWSGYVQGVVGEATINQATAFFVDLYNPIANGAALQAGATTTPLTFDAIHPNQYGHEVMARAMYQRFIAAANPQGYALR